MRKKMQDQFPVALDVFVRGLRAGHPIAAALDLLTVEMPDPIGSQFGIVVDEVTYGADLRDALTAMADRWDLDDMRMFVVSLSVQSETGGNLAEILENLSQVIRERASMMLKVRALSSEGRMTAVMLTALAGSRLHLAVHRQPQLLPRCRRRSGLPAGLRRLLILYASASHDPAHGRFEGVDGDDRNPVHRRRPYVLLVLLFRCRRGVAFSALSCSASGARRRGWWRAGPSSSRRSRCSRPRFTTHGARCWLALVNAIEKAGIPLVDTKDATLRSGWSLPATPQTYAPRVYSLIRLSLVIGLPGRSCFHVGRRRRRRFDQALSSA